MYNFQAIESKWQKFWEKNSIHKAKDTNRGARSPWPYNKEKNYYILEMYPYPSGDLHIGHLRNYVIGDTITRFKLMQGYNCLHPFGWDSFGLPAEEAAIGKGINPRAWTMNNINTSRNTLKLMGISYDWDREIITSEPDYYKWTQWLFLKLYENGLAYRKEAYVNWCPHCQTTLANEQVHNGECWRCETLVVKKEFTQWFFKITAYAERLLSNLDKLTGWPEKVKNLQRNWIGRSEGLEIDFHYNGRKVPVFTTRPDTIYGVTFMAISPADELAKELTTHDSQLTTYIENSLRRPEIERTRTKDGVFTGEYAINPVSGEKVPLWIADYVLPSYGTGVIMGVPAHDERDFEFAKAHKLPIRMVIQPVGARCNTSLQEAYTGHGTMINSGPFNGLPSQQGMNKIEEYIKEKGLGRSKVNYHLKDWLISRQRYWGTPIPIIYCDRCGIIPVPLNDLPVRLPEEVDFMPKGKSPLASASKFINTNCPKCRGKAFRDPDTMDTFVDSSWYWLRYLDPKNEAEPFSQESTRKWLPIDEYIGGIEHACGHLIYFRFISQFLYDIGLLKQEEPCIKLFTHGMITDINGQVMSKSKGNAVPVQPFVNEWGADTARLTILFIGPPSQDSAWSLEVVAGASRFLSRVYNLVNDVGPTLMVAQKPGAGKIRAPTALYRTLNYTIKKVTHDIENFGQNTAIATLMVFVNQLYKAKQSTYRESKVLSPPWRESAPGGNLESRCPSGLGLKDDPWLGYSTRILVQLLAPFAPHLAEELWIEKLKNKESVFRSKWPEWEEVDEPNVTLIVEINGRVRGRLELPKDTSEGEVKSRALQIPNVASRIKEIKKIIFVPNKLINFVSTNH